MPPRFQSDGTEKQICPTDADAFAVHCRSPSRVPGVREDEIPGFIQIRFDNHSLRPILDDSRI
jgi:hypothetical protein